MTTESLRVAVVGQDPVAGSADEVWVRLEQLVPPTLAWYPTVRDLYTMWNAAATGRSARTIKPVGCPVEFVGSDIHVYLGFYAWPSTPELAYSLTATLGSISAGQLIRKAREFSVMVDNATRIDLPYYMDDLAWEWETPVFDRDGGRISPPSITNHNTWLEFGAETFGALRISGAAVGFYHLSEMVLSKPLTEEEISAEEQQEIDQQQLDDGRIIYTPRPTTRLNGYRIENMENTITAAWLDTDGGTDTDQLRLTIPPCVEDVLNFCPDMYATIVLQCDQVATRQVYYSTCKEDTIVEIVDGVDPVSYCQDISGKKIDVSPWGGHTL